MRQRCCFTLRFVEPRARPVYKTHGVHTDHVLGGYKKNQTTQRGQDSAVYCSVTYRTVPTRKYTVVYIATETFAVFGLNFFRRISFNCSAYERGRSLINVLQRSVKTSGTISTN